MSRYQSAVQEIYSLLRCSRTNGSGKSSKSAKEPAGHTESGRQEHGTEQVTGGASASTNGGGGECSGKKKKTSETPEGRSSVFFQFFFF